MRNLAQRFKMEKSGSKRNWKPIGTAPVDAELELSVYDGGEFHVLAFPCRRDGLSWIDMRLNKTVPISPTHWRLAF